MGSARVAVVVVMIVVETLVARAQPSQPDPFVADTERVLGDFARDIRKQRIHGGIALLVLGGASVGGGYLLAQTEDQGGLVDLSPLVRGFGYLFIATGSVSLVAGTVSFFTTFEPEREHAALRSAIERGEGRAASLRARAKVADHAAGERRSRAIMRGAGFVVLGASVVAGAVGFAIRNDGDREWPFYAGAIGGAAIGSGLLLGARIDGAYTGVQRRFRVATATVTSAGPRPDGLGPIRSIGLVPVRDGAVLSLGGRF